METKNTSRTPASNEQVDKGRKENSGTRPREDKPQPGHDADNDGKSLAEGMDEEKLSDI